MLRYVGDLIRGLTPGVALVLVAGTAACNNNACQDICLRMSEYAQECGFTIPEAEVDACIDDQAGATGDDKAVCRDYGGAQTIRDEWSCEELADYWGSGTATPAE